MAEPTPDLPRPRATLWRRLGVALAGLLLVALVLGLVLHLSGRVQHGRAVDRFEEALAEQVPSPMPPGLLRQIAGFAPEPVRELDNAAHFLVAGAKAVVWDMDELRAAKALLPLPHTEWSAEQHALVERLVERNQSGLATMARASALSGSDFGLAYDDLPNLEVPNLLELMNAGILLSLEARVALAADDVEKALANYETIARLTQSLRRETILIFSLVAHVTEKLVLQGVVEVVTSSEPWAHDPAVLDRVAALLPDDDLLTFTRRVVAIDAAVMGLTMIEGGAEEFGLEQDTSWLGRYLMGHRYAASFLDEGRRTALLSHHPAGTHPELFDAPVPDGVSQLLGTAYRGSVGKAQVMLSQRHLVTAVFALHRKGVTEGWGSDPCSIFDELTGDDPLMGTPILCQPQEDGSLHLEVPGAEPMIGEIVSPNFKSLWITAVDLPWGPGAAEPASLGP